MAREARERSLTRRTVFLTVLLAAGAPAPLALALEAPVSAPAAQATPCPRPALMEGTGLVCPRADGLFEVVGRDGSVLGLVHEPDPVPSHDVGWAAFDGPTRPPACVDPLEEPFHAIVIYARAVDDEDRYAEYAPKVRHLVERANFILSSSADVTGTTADYRVLCDEEGRVAVRNAVLPTPRAHASFVTIHADLVALGYADARTKLWVWYDDPGACACGGQALLTQDGSRSVRNSQNGNWPNPLTGVTFGHLSVRVMMHENGHTMGALLSGAPHGTGGAHCWDGADIMCYDDGARFGHLYSTRKCPRSMPFDCGNDDYFHPDPPADAFTARYWNLASPLNRFVNGCHHATALVVGAPEASAGLVTRAVTLDVPQECRGRPAAAWVVDAATQNHVFHALRLCWQDADGTDIGCVEDARRLTPFPLAHFPVTLAEVEARVPDVTRVTAVVTTDATGPVKVWFRVA